jgi:hypothetical protein
MQLPHRTVSHARGASPRAKLLPEFVEVLALALLRLPPLLDRHPPFVRFLNFVFELDCPFSRFSQDLFLFNDLSMHSGNDRLHPLDLRAFDFAFWIDAWAFRSLIFRAVSACSYCLSPYICRWSSSRSSCIS